MVISFKINFLFYTLEFQSYRSILEKSYFVNFFSCKWDLRFRFIQTYIKNEVIHSGIASRQVKRKSIHAKVLKSGWILLKWARTFDRMGERNPRWNFDEIDTPPHHLDHQINNAALDPALKDTCTNVFYTTKITDIEQHSQLF